MTSVDLKNKPHHTNLPIASSFEIWTTHFFSVSWWRGNHCLFFLS